MKTNLICAALVAALLSSTAAVAQMGGGAPVSSGQPARAHTTDAGKVGSAVGKPLSAASAAMQKQDWPTALASLKDAQAVPDQNAYETYMINKFLSFVYINTKDFPDATTAIQAAADSPAMPDADAKDILHNALLLAAQAQQNQKVIAYAQRLEPIAPLDAQLSAMVAVSYYDLKDMAHAKDYAQKSLDASKAAGTPPEANASAIVMNAQAKSDPAAALRTLEQMAVSYNHPEDWDKLVGVSLGTKGLANVDALNMYRLLNLMGPMLTGDDYTYLGNLAVDQRDPKEAAVVLEAGVAAGKIQSSAMLTKARTSAASDERVLSQAASAAEKSKRGDDDMQIAQDYWGYGRYADVEATARAALAKGGVKDPGEANLLIGMALVAQGKYDAGKAQLAQVSGSEGRMKTAHLWTLYAEAKTQGAAPAAPAH